MSQAAAAAKAKDQEGDKKREEHDKEENQCLSETEKEFEGTYGFDKRYIAGNFDRSC